MKKDTKENKSYRHILKSTSIMGGSSLINIFLRIVRTKILAVLLGPSGVGLIGIYDSITTGISNVVGMGIGSSGVQQIAAANGTGDENKISRTIISLRRMALISGIAGACLLFFLSGPLSRLTFGNYGHRHALEILSLTIFFIAVSSGQTALIQGMRKIRDLAILSVLGTLLGTLLSIPIIYAIGESGIVVFLVIASAMSILTSWWYSRKIKVSKVRINLADTISVAKPLLRLGLAFMAASLLVAGTSYLLRVLVVKSFDLSAVGAYQAATTLSSVYVGIILTSMATDFYPRLTAVAHDKNECKSLINKQIEIGFLLAVPGILATITFSPYIIKILYSSKFSPAVDILRWQSLGVLLQVITWPMGFMLRAIGNGKLFFWTELFDNSIYLGLSWIGIMYCGLPGTGMALLGKNLLYGLLMYRIITTKYSYSISPENKRHLKIMLPATAFVFINPYLFTDNVALLISAGITIAIGLFSLNKVVDLADGSEMMPVFLVRIKARFGF